MSFYIYCIITGTPSDLTPDYSLKLNVATSCDILAVTASERIGFGVRPNSRADRP